MLPQFMKLVDEAKKEIKEITVDDLKKLLTGQDNFTLIDVREPNEVAQGHIGNAVPVPRGVLELQIDSVTQGYEEAIVLYCGGGNRSALAAASLKKMGFTNVMSLIGGWRAWCERG
ncbi:MAG TPA: rhodanese-like domain-containing protein [Candidatus Acidoferrales bacterium]